MHDSIKYQSFMLFVKQPLGTSGIQKKRSIIEND